MGRKIDYNKIGGKSGWEIIKEIREQEKNLEKEKTAGDLLWGKNIKERNSRFGTGEISLENDDLNKKYRINQSFVNLPAFKEELAKKEEDLIRAGLYIPKNRKPV